MFVRIGDKTVFRYTEEYQSGLECDEKELKQIGKLKRLSKLDISSKDVRSLDFVYDPSNMKELFIHCTPNLDMSSLSECSKLEILYITATILDSFEDISTLTTLKDVELMLCNNYDISGIKKLKKLETFVLINCKSGPSITGIEELSELPNLTHISLDHAKNSDVVAIAKCENLTSLSLVDSDEIIDSAELLELKKLKNITFSRDMVDETLINSLKKIMLLYSYYNA